MKVCQTCGEQFSKIGLHWYYNESHRPDISQYMDILQGILMGDGTIDSNSGNPRLVVEMVNKRYLEHIDSVLSTFSNGVHLHRSSEENSKRGVLGNNSGNYRDTYRLETVRHPKLEKLSEWYSSGNKVFPNDIELTRVTLKHWYVCDGYFRNTSGHNSIEIGIQNESDNRAKIDNLFSKQSLPEPTWYDSGNSVLIRFTNEDSVKLFDYMGEPLPGFEYKWPGDT